jgi:hypothetical protein
VSTPPFTIIFPFSVATRNTGDKQRKSGQTAPVFSLGFPAAADGFAGNPGGSASQVDNSASPGQWCPEDLGGTELPDSEAPCVWLLSAVPSQG